ncbi:MAG: polysaccharide deacetylase [Roseburia sp.]|nr:polysaccharide deacetylase [Roseburia sp.]
MADTTKDDLYYRKKRVKRIKRIIVTLGVVLILLPIVLSVVLFCRVRSLENRLETIIAENGLEKQENQASTGVVKAEEKKTPEPVSPAAVQTETKRKVYLTFDDGPSKQTEKVLDVLKKKNVKATFFMIGREDAYSQRLYKRVAEEGHTLGMHSYSHLNTEIYGSLDGFKKDFTRISDLLFDVTGVRSAFYRFPGGSSNAVNHFPIKEYAKFLEEQGVTYMDWNVIAANGTTDNVTKKEMVQSVVDGVAKYDTSVVLLYDSADKKMTAKSLEDIIDELLDGGYEILPMDADTVPIQHAS